MHLQGSKLEEMHIDRACYCHVNLQFHLADWPEAQVNARPLSTQCTMLANKDSVVDEIFLVASQCMSASVKCVGATHAHGTQHDLVCLAMVMLH